MQTEYANLPLIRLQGSHEEIGFQHGARLRRRIRENYAFYTEKLMVLRGFDLEHFGRQFLECVRGRFPHYAREMEAIAAGAEIPSWQIGVLNARTEIFVKTLDTLIGECSACFCPRSGLLGENWDWMKESESLVVLLDLTHEDGHRLMMVAEPGIIGKVGINSAGLAVALNILHGNEFQVAIPIHVLLRAVLDCRSLDEARTLLEGEPVCAFSNLMIADAEANVIDMEFMGSQRQWVTYEGEDPIHTNHYLGLVRNETHNPMYASSVRRLERLRQLRRECDDMGETRMKRLLGDRDGGKDAICSPFHEQLHFCVGTVCSIIMDPRNRTLTATAGSPYHHDYRHYRL